MASRYHPPSRSSMFLLELIISIFFFSVAGAVCIRLYTGAHRISVRSQERTRAVSLAADAAECFLGADNTDEHFLTLLTGLLNGGEDGAGSAGLTLELRGKGGFRLPDGISGGDITFQYLLRSEEGWETLLTGWKSPSEDGALTHLDICARDGDGAELCRLDILRYDREGE